MALWNKFASSFLPVNRMGDKPSTQNTAEAQEEQNARQKAWSPSDISESSEEDTKPVDNSRSLAPNTSMSKHRAQNVKPYRQSNGRERRQPHAEVVTSHPRRVYENTGNVLASSSSFRSRTAPDFARSYEEITKTVGEEDTQGQTRSTSDQSADSLDTPYARMLKRPRANSTSSSEAANSPQSEEPSRRDGISVYKCPKATLIGCNKAFSSQHEADEHAREDHEKSPLRCSLCARTFRKASRLRKHLSSHNIAENGPTDQQENSKCLSQDEHIDVVEQPYREEPVVANVQRSHQTATDVIEETPLVHEELKRKRSTLEASSLQDDQANPRKRKKRQPLSLPMVVVSEDEQESQSVTSGSNILNSQRLEKPRAETKKNGNLEGFAKPWTPGSNLRHPIHNPTSPKSVSSLSAYVVIPRTSEAGPSKTPATTYRKQQARPESTGSNDEQTPLAQKQTKMTMTSRKGKRRAEPGVAYSSPPLAEKPVSDDMHEPDHQGLATTVARRTDTQQNRRKALRSGERSASASFTSADDTNSDVDEEEFQCQDCEHSFRSKDGLRRHRKKSHTAEKAYGCDDCTSTFISLAALQNHQKQSKHGSNASNVGRKGAFTNGEVRKLDNWRDAFCEEYDINVQTFNQMMTDSCRRSKSFRWPYRYITKADFLQEYYDVLPGRNRRSMHRYRERAFQNVPEKQTWTEEDDEELLRLVKDIGPKWVEIGQLMTRTQDSVNQRWRHKLQYRGETHKGEWPAEEVQELQDAVKQVKRESGISLDPNADVRMPWDSVSKKLKGKRTAQQCSNKWRLLYQKREGNQFLKPTELDRKMGNNFSAATPSKISQRLIGDTPTATAPSSSTKKEYTVANLVATSESSDHSIAHSTEASIEPPSVELLADKDEGEVAVASNQGRHRQSDATTPELDNRADTPEHKGNPFRRRTPKHGSNLSQTFAQTQANTSALRAPTTGRRQHTQTEMPTPGLPIQYRRTLSLQSQSISNGSASGRHSAASPSRPRDRSVHQDDDADVIAEPRSSSEEPLSVSAQESSAAESDSSTSESPLESIDDRHRRERSTDSSTTSSTSRPDSDSASDSTSSEAVESDDDSMVEDAQRDVFMQSLHASSSRPAISPDTNSTIKYRPKIDWKNVLNQNGPAQPMDSDTDDEDEGDIQHH